MRLNNIRKVPWIAAALAAPVLLAVAAQPALADASANALLDRCIAAEKSAKTLQASFTLHGSDIKTTRGELCLKKPNIARIRVSKEGSSDTVVTHSDGRSLTIYSTEQNEYAREAADIGGGNVTRDCEVLEAAAFFNPDLLDRMRFGHVATMVANAMVGGVACRVVQVKADAGNIWKVYIGPDNLLRGYSEKIHRNGELVTRESRISGLKAGAALAADALAWALPKGAKSVQEVAASRNTPSSGTSNEEQGLLPAGGAMPSFSLPSLSGPDVTLAAEVKRNKVTLVNFWASWCGPCRAELPELSKMLNDLHGKGFNILSVNIGDDAATVSKIWKEGNLSMHAVLHGEKVQANYHIEAIPTNYVLGQDGKILARFEGFDEQGIRSALAKAGVK